MSLFAEIIEEYNFNKRVSGIHKDKI